MNDKLLIGHTVKLPSNEHIGLLEFIHPTFKCVDQHTLDAYDNPKTDGLVFIGKPTNDNVEKLNRITPNWIIVNNNEFDVDLTNNESLIKNLLPLQYIRIKNSTKVGDTPVYNMLSYDKLTDQIKVCLVDSDANITCDTTLNDQSVLYLFESILSTPKVLTTQYFTTVNHHNINSIASSVLTFLCKVQSQTMSNTSVMYSRLIMQSYRRYGKRIKQGIANYVKSKSCKELALYNLLIYLNKAR